MAFSENFDSGSGELSTSGSWTKVGNDPAVMLLDFYDGGLGASADGGSGDCGYVHTGQGTAARVEARLRKLSSNSPILCPKLTDANNHGGLRIFGTGSIGARLVIVDAGVQDDTGIRFQGVVDTWYAVEQDGAGGWEIEEGGTGGTPSWSSVGTHTDAAHDSETVQGFMSPSNTAATFGSSAAWWDDYSADALGGGGTTGSITEGATAGETFSAKATTAASIMEAASAGETMSATAAAAASLSAAVQAGDTEAGPAAALAAITAAADAGDTEAATAQAAAAITAGAAAGETWVAKVAALADITAGATADEAMTTGTQQALDGAISEGSTAAAAFAAAAATLGSLTAAATAAESITATVAAIASLSEGIQAGDTFTAGLADEGRIVVQSIAIVAAVSGSPGIEASMKGAPGVGTRLKGTPTIH